MKKIMIADDEVLVRIGIKSMLVWEQHGYTIVCDASDGREAWEKIREYHPDIVLTDLKMAPGDGFELIEKCKKAYPEIRFIVLSNYNDFDNVRRAMKLGASDYVFKLTINPGELLGILDEVSAGIPEQTEDGASDRITGENLEVIKNNLMRQALDEGAAFGGRAEEQLKQLQLSVNLWEPFVLIAVRIDNFKAARKKGEFLETDLLTFTLTNIMEEIFRKEQQAEVFHVRKGEFLVAVPDRAYIRQETADCFLNLVESVRQYYGLEISGGISNTGKGFSWLREGEKQARAALECNFFGNSGALYSYEPVCWEEMRVPEEYRTIHLQECLERSDFPLAKNYVERLLTYLEEGKRFCSGDVRRKLKRVYSLFEIFMEKCGIKTESVCDSRGLNMAEAVEAYDFFIDMKKSVRELLDSYETLFKEKVMEGRKYRQAVNQVKRYVEEHLDGELTVAAAASLMGMSESRFSHIFKEESGYSYTEYVNSVRMKEATALLRDTDMMISEIAEKVGIENPNYFSAQYKKRTGKSPNEFRKSLLK